MSKLLERLLVKIARARNDLYQASHGHLCLSDPVLLQKSKNLDVLINRYMLLQIKMNSRHNVNPWVKRNENKATVTNAWNPSHKDI
ncbi:MAG: aspartyl-phosphate phosphatase Spo0E family protein [Bacillus sp. (in: Bacteria)]|nr:aspartyl-phosphate phosphatase Spo0E family protein [Bacillus sp. (in: firmicutes)]